MFERIQIRGIRRKRQERTARLLPRFIKAPALMKRGMLKDDDTAVGQYRQALFF